MLYDSNDNLTENAVIDKFVQRFYCDLTVMDKGEHWFHMEMQLSFLNSWARQNS